MKSMNYQEWLKILLGRIERWGEVGRPEFEGYPVDVREPETDEELLAMAAAILPGDICEFYKTASAGCDIEFSINPPRGFQYRDIPLERQPVLNQIHCGFSLAPIEELEDIREEMIAAIDSAEEDFGLKPGVKDLRAAAQPIYITPGGDFLVWLRPNKRFESGIYFLMKEQLWPDAEEYEGRYLFKYAPSFSGWLEFLEKSCYVGPEWDDVCSWHDGEVLRVNAENEMQLLGLIE